jgi:hypothetical protein
MLDVHSLFDPAAMAPPATKQEPIGNRLLRQGKVRTPWQDRWTLSHSACAARHSLSPSCSWLSELAGKP